MAAALHSSMAPVLASLETFDRNYVAGREVETSVVLINETHDDVSAKLDLYVTPRDPLFVPDADALAAAVWHDSKPVELPADSIAREMIRFHVPKIEGSYFLAAVLSRDGDAPVVSQRVVRAVNASATVASLKGRRVVLLGGDDVVRSWLTQHGCKVVAQPADGDVILIWDAATLTDAERGMAPTLRAFAEAGGRIVVANQTSWSWTELADCRIGLPEFEWRNPVVCSRAHAYEGIEHPLLTDVPATWLWRWNGLPGAIANEILLDDSPALQQGRKLLWASKPEFTAALSLPIGAGEIVFCQLRLRDRIRRDGEPYDPVAERVLANLLTR
jgi:hypothetical protein